MGREKLGVYSGECRLGDVGDPTKLIDAYDEPLFVGDIVVTHVGSPPDIHGLTVIVCDEDGIPFVMGIKSVDFMAEGCQWGVLRVKSYKNVIAGENWPEFGFSYRADD